MKDARPCTLWGAHLEQNMSFIILIPSSPSFCVFVTHAHTHSDTFRPASLSKPNLESSLGNTICNTYCLPSRPTGQPPHQNIFSLAGRTRLPPRHDLNVASSGTVTFTMQINGYGRSCFYFYFSWESWRSTSTFFFSPTLLHTDTFPSTTKDFYWWRLCCSNNWVTMAAGGENISYPKLSSQLGIPISNLPFLSHFL